MSEAVERFWGEEKDREAIKQLRLEGDYTITMMGHDIDFIEDEDWDEIAIEFDGMVSVGEIAQAYNDRVRRVRLPFNFMFVGLSPVGRDAPMAYGVVDFSKFNRDQIS